MNKCSCYLTCWLRSNTVLNCTEIYSICSVETRRNDAIIGSINWVIRRVLVLNSKFVFIVLQLNINFDLFRVHRIMGMDKTVCWRWWIKISDVWITSEEHQSIEFKKRKLEICSIDNKNKTTVYGITYRIISIVASQNIWNIFTGTNRSATDRRTWLAIFA